jgi:ribosomal-protein-alanine N-acetyltransferase
MQAIAIKKMTLDHIPEVMDIENSTFTDSWSKALFLEEIDAEAQKCYLVAQNDTEVVGYAGMMRVASDVHVTNLAVKHEKRNRGIGTRLMVNLMLAAQDWGVNAATLEVRVKNKAALDLYYKLGFVPSGTRPKYYSDGEDALILWCEDLYGLRQLERLHAIERELVAAGVGQ